MFRINNWHLLTIFMFLNALVHATLTPKSPKSHKQPKPKPEKVRLGPQEESVLDRNLVTKNPTAREILENHQAYYRDTSHTHLNALVLGYVTPWNNHGYEVAKIFANKFSHISPVWLQVRRSGDLKYEVTGTHDVDVNWMTDVRMSGKKRRVRIVPRVLFDGWTGNDFVSVLTKGGEKGALAKALVDVCIQFGFDGLVVEVWSQLAGRVKYESLVDLVREIGRALREEHYDLILVIPPLRSQEALFGAEHYEHLYDYMTAFSLMTYDFSNPQRPGPNAPYTWMEKCVKTVARDREGRDKILTGLNFYGNDYTPTGGGPIVFHDYLKKVKLFDSEINYDPHSEENYFELSEEDGKHVVFYPTLYSINKRVSLAKKLGTGLSIWELGQGLDYFYDLL